MSQKLKDTTQPPTIISTIVIFVRKITGIGQLLLKLSLVVGWDPFLRHSVLPAEIFLESKLRKVLCIYFIWLELFCARAQNLPNSWLPPFPRHIPATTR